MSSKYSQDSKYPYAPINNGAFFFPTDEGCHVVVVIEESGYVLWQSDYLSNQDNVYSFRFKRDCDDGYHDLDDSVCKTIYGIIVSNMVSNGDTCVYYHHWQDDTHFHHFYDHFYDEMEFMMPDFESFEFPWLDENGAPGTTSVFVHKANPDKDMIIQEFKKTIEMPSDAS